MAQRFQSVLDGLEARSVACPQDLRSYTAPAEANCFTVTEEFRAVRRAIAREFDSANAAKLPFTGWVRDRDYRLRLVLGSSDVFAVLFDTERGLVAVAAEQSCPSDPGVHVIDDGNYESPRRIEFEHPDYPERARQTRQAGAVIARVVIDENGNVGDVCFLHVDPAGAGFEEAAARAFLRWRYEPARLDGKPVPVYMIATASWSTP